MVKDPPGTEDQLPVWSSLRVTEVHGSDAGLWTETFWAQILSPLLSG